MNSLFLPAHGIPQYTCPEAAACQSSCNDIAEISCYSGGSAEHSRETDHCNDGVTDEPQSVDTCNDVFHESDINSKWYIISKES